jgi:hypothetical protein
MAGTEVGVAFVSLVPSARGFSKLVQRELKQELRGDRTPKIQVRPEVDAKTARAELQTQLTGLSRDAKVRVNVEVDQQETARRLTRSLGSVNERISRRDRLNIETDVDPIRLAQQTRAAVAFAQAVAGKIDIETDVDRDRARFVGNLLARAVGGGVQSGGNAIQSAVMTPIQGTANNPIVSSAGIALGIALAVPLGAALAGALPAAITVALASVAGLGVIGLAAFLVKDDPNVRKAAGELGKTASTTFKDAAKPLAPAFAESLTIIKDLIVELGPDIREMFAAIQPAIVPLTQGLAEFVRGIMPGFLALVRASVPILTQLANSLGPLGRDLGAMFGIIANGAPVAADFLRHLLGFVGALLKGLGRRCVGHRTGHHRSRRRDRARAAAAARPGGVVGLGHRPPQGRRVPALAAGSAGLGEGGDWRPRHAADQVRA